MSCEEIRNLALLAACGEAGESESAIVRQHASHCPPCAREIRTLHEGLELLNHVPTEQPSAEARAALGSLLLREAPRAQAVPSVSSRPAWFWAAAAAVLLVAAAGGLTWKVMNPGAVKKQEIAHTPVEPAPAPKKPENKTARVTKPRDDWSSWSPAAHDDIDSLSDSIKGLRGGSSTPKAKPDRTAVWFPESTTAVDSMYDSLDSITTTSDKF